MTVTVRREVLARAERQVKHGNARSVSAWVDAAMEEKARREDLAALLDRDKAYVSRVLNGRTPTITIETLALFLDRLGHRLVVDCVAAQDLPATNVDARPKRTKPAASTRAAAE